MENLIEVVSVPAIVSIVYMALAVYKKTVSTEKALKFVPLIAVLLGVVLGIVAFYAVPDCSPAGNILTAILVGGVSGLAATGSYPPIKQNGKAEKPDDNND